MSAMATEISLDHSQTTAFMDYLERWTADLAPLPLERLIDEAGGARHIGIFCVDLINGFCYEGPLRSERVRRIVPPIASLFNRAYDAGITHFVLAQDRHDANAAEFEVYPPHCVRGTEEAQTVPELLQLPFAAKFNTVHKNTIHSGINTGLDQWLEAHPQITYRIVVGDCTDLCTYHLALYLKFRSDAANRHDPVIVPADCVDTYDVSVETAQAQGIPAHPAAVFHPMFLYSMAMNGVRVVRSLT